MLHAILRGKLDLLTPDAQRLEDAVTSTVFGTLALVDRWDLLSRWLSGSDGNPNGPVNHGMWFWPTLRTPQCTSIPDVCVRIGNALFVVEAKYASGRHDLVADAETPEQVLDQLVRQHICTTVPAHSRIGYHEDIYRALDECQATQVFLVDARKIRRARIELKQSVEREPRMRISLVTWQQLDRQLYEHRTSHRWALDLRQFLELEGLSAFVGFGRVVGKVPATILGWGGRRPADAIRIREAIRPLRHVRLAPVQLWRTDTKRPDGGRRWRSITPRLLPTIRSVRRWRSQESNNRSTHGRR
jgi:hypothetical protein